MDIGRERFRVAVSKILLRPSPVHVMIERHNLKIAVVGFIELLHMGSVGSLDIAIVLGRARGQDNEADTTILTGMFEGGVEL